MDANDEDRLLLPETAAAYERRNEDDISDPRPNACAELENDIGSILIDVE
jgi:hypothetical protein